jgi:hypothetical protein
VVQQTPAATVIRLCCRWQVGFKQRAHLRIASFARMNNWVGIDELTHTAVSKQQESQQS